MTNPQPLETMASTKAKIVIEQSLDLAHQHYENFPVASFFHVQSRQIQACCGGVSAGRSGGI